MADWNAPRIAVEVAIEAETAYEFAPFGAFDSFHGIDGFGGSVEHGSTNSAPKAIAIDGPA